ncbi:MAG: DNA polymerase III subunit gamma/tau [Elainellaceae cyanobacterium]
MPYEPLHHKYRPQTFAELVGQTAIATTLSSALCQQRIAPAYLFTGPRGTGKTSSARILAKSLNCLAGEVPTETPCGICDVCRAIARGSALDVIEIDAASNTGVDNIRELIERAQFAPVQCRFKVYVIDECHMLSTAAFNALLKTLEEPPEHVVFVLATTDPQRVLPTIISRCQRFDFRRIPLTDMVQHLIHIVEKEHIDITDEAVELVAQISQGGLRDAESLLDQLSLLDGCITVDRVWDLVGAVPERDLLELVKAIATDSGTAVLDWARHLMNRGREPLIVLQNLASFYRDLLVAKTASDRRDLVAITETTWADMCEFAQQMDTVTILAGQQHLRTSEAQVKHTTQPRLWLEVTLMGLLPSALNLSSPVTETKFTNPRSPSQAAVPPTAGRSPQPASPTSHSTDHPTTKQTPPASPQPIASPSPLTQRPRQPEPARSTSQPRAEGSKSPPPEDSLPAQPEPQSPPKTAHQDLSHLWQQVIEHLHPLSKALLRDHGHLASFNGHHVTIGIRSKNLLKIAQSRIPDIEQAFRAAVSQDVSVDVVIRSDTPTPAESSSPDERLPVEASASAPVPPPPFVSTPVSPAEPITETPPHPASQAEPHPADQPSTASATGADAEEASKAYEIPSWQDDDEVSKAARLFAQMFNGEVVNLSDDIDNGKHPQPRNSSNPPPQRDDDVPF